MNLLSTRITKSLLNTRVTKAPMMKLRPKSIGQLRMGDQCMTTSVKGDVQEGKSMVRDGVDGEDSGMMDGLQGDIAKAMKKLRMSGATEVDEGKAVASQEIVMEDGGVMMAKVDAEMVEAEEPSVDEDKVMDSKVIGDKVVRKVSWIDRVDGDAKMSDKGSSKRKVGDDGDTKLSKRKYEKVTGGGHIMGDTSNVMAPKGSGRKMVEGRREPGEDGPSDQLDMKAHWGLRAEKIERVRMRALERANEMIGKSKLNEGGDELTVVHQEESLSEVDRHHRAGTPSRKELENRSWLIRTLHKICRSKCKPMRLHKCRFENTKEAADFNGRWLKHYKWDLCEAIKRQKGTMLEPGSEFRKWETIRELWSKHENGEKLGKIIEQGLTYPLDTLPENKRKKDLDHMVARGNHKSAEFPEINKQTLMKNYTDETEKGWMLPIPKRSLEKLKGAAVIPVGVHTQYTIDEFGGRKVKRRTTHDASFAPMESLSINERMIRELLTDCYYGHCLLRVLHNIHTMRRRCPKTKILIIKYDIDSAYRRLHVAVLMALLTITVIGEIAYVLLRLPFGVANGPNDFSIVSECIFDLECAEE